MSLGGQTVTVVNTGEPAGYNGVGEPIYSNPTRTVVQGCSLQQIYASRDIDVTDVSVARARLFAPPSAPLRATSIVVEGTIDSWPLTGGDNTPYYLVDGDPATWTDLNGAAHHIECYLRRQSG